CGWKPHSVGKARPGAKVTISAGSHGINMLLQVNLGIHAADPGSANAIAVSGTKGVINPSVEFTVPAGGEFQVPWATDPRPGSAASPPELSLKPLTGGGTVRFPADEVFVFTNREMYATAMIFNLTPADRNIVPPGKGGQVVFPNAHVWLSSSWTSA